MSTIFSPTAIFNALGVWSTLTRDFLSFVWGEKTYLDYNDLRLLLSGTCTGMGSFPCEYGYKNAAAKLERLADIVAIEAKKQNLPEDVMQAHYAIIAFSKVISDQAKLAPYEKMICVPWGLLQKMTDARAGINCVITGIIDSMDNPLNSLALLPLTKLSLAIEKIAQKHEVGSSATISKDEIDEKFLPRWIFPYTNEQAQFEEAASYAGNILAKTEARCPAGAAFRAQVISLRR